MAPEVHHLFHHPIADHSFSADRQTLAVARDINVELYHRSGAGKFALQDELKGHDKTVTSVDIAPSSGRIVTCSQGEAMRDDAIAGLAMLYISPLILVIRPECICLGAFSFWLEAHPGAPPHQSGGNLCPMVAFRTQIRCGLGGSCNSNMLF